MVCLSTRIKHLILAISLSLRVGNHAERFNIKEGETTARLNFDREPRYYADLGFDRGVWYMANSPTKTDVDTWWLKSRGAEIGQSSPIPIAGFYMKKALNWHYEWATVTYLNYPWPEMRLADLYLLYAEAIERGTRPGRCCLYLLKPCKGKGRFAYRSGFMDKLQHQPNKVHYKRWFAFYYPARARR
jgi:hypothetical protein